MALVSSSPAKNKVDRGVDVCLLGCWVSSTPGRAVDLGYELGVDPCVDDGLHHGQMLKIIVSLEQGIASKELD